jgi:hypothetical protein
MASPEQVKSNVPTDLRVALLWHGNVVDERTFKHDSALVTIGEDVKNTFTVPTQSMPGSWNLLKPTAGGNYTLLVADEMGGKLTMGEESVPLKEYLQKSADQGRTNGGREIALGPKDWGLVTLGDVGFFFQSTPKVDKLKKTGLVTDTQLVVILTICAVVFGVVMFLARTLWDPNILDSGTAIQQRIMQFIPTQATPPPPKEEKLPEAVKKENVGKKHMGKEGKAGEKDKPKHIKTKIPEDKRPIQINVTKIGALGSLNSNAVGGALKDVFDSNTQGFGNQLSAAMNGTGNEFVMGHGSGGWSTKGTGTGGGGTGWGRVWGTANVDTGGGRGVRARIGGKKQSNVVFRTEAPQADESNCLNKGQISRVVMAHKAGVQFCYEKELQRDPKIAGKIVVNWTISPEGRVQRSSVESSSMGNSNVEGCIRGQVTRWIFPQAACQSVVSFPFVFKSALE